MQDNYLRNEEDKMPSAMTEFFANFIFWPSKIERISIKYWYIIVASGYLLLTVISMKTGSIIWLDPGQRTYNFALGGTVLMAICGLQAHQGVFS